MKCVVPDRPTEMPYRADYPSRSQPKRSRVGETDATSFQNMSVYADFAVELLSRKGSGTMNRAKCITSLAGGTRYDHGLHHSRSEHERKEKQFSEFNRNCAGLQSGTALKR